MMMQRAPLSSFVILARKFRLRFFCGAAILAAPRLRGWEACTTAHFHTAR
jgi:hypothetical protein